MAEKKFFENFSVLEYFDFKTLFGIQIASVLLQLRTLGVFFDSWKNKKKTAKIFIENVDLLIST